jgi:hypothetical protein
VERVNERCLPSPSGLSHPAVRHPSELTGPTAVNTSMVEPMKRGRRYVAKGVPGGYRIWNNKRSVGGAICMSTALTTSSMS